MCDQLTSRFPDPQQVFNRITDQCRVILAVSGGSDSMALLRLAAIWSGSHNISLVVVTVDHGLRAKAAAEAAFVAKTCNALGVRHETLNHSWQDRLPESRISERARQARYRLLEKFATETGAAQILLGHTSDDQAETVWMRNARNGGNPQWRGLAGMAERVFMPSGVTLSRPLLGFSRQTLRDYLVELGQEWIEDPSNTDRRFERVRVRQSLAHASIDRSLICRLAALSGRQRKTITHNVAQSLLTKLQVSPGPVLSVSQCVLQEQIPGQAELAAQVLTAIVGGRAHFISHKSSIEIMNMKPGQKMTAGYSIIERGHNGYRFYREKRNLPVVRIAPESRAVWDDRLVIHNDTSRAFTCLPCDHSHISQLRQEDIRRRFLEIGPAFFSMPVLVDEADENACIFPFANSVNDQETLRFSYRVPAIECYCSECDLALLDVVNYVRAKIAGPAVTNP